MNTKSLKLSKWVIGGLVAILLLAVAVVVVRAQQSYVPLYAFVDSSAITVSFRGELTNADSSTGDFDFLEDHISVTSESGVGVAISCPCNLQQLPPPGFSSIRMPFNSPALVPLDEILTIRYTPPSQNPVPGLRDFNLLGGRSHNQAYKIQLDGRVTNLRTGAAGSLGRVANVVGFDADARNLYFARQVSNEVTVLRSDLQFNNLTVLFSVEVDGVVRDMERTSQGYWLLFSDRLAAYDGIGQKGRVVQLTGGLDYRMMDSRQEVFYISDGGTVHRYSVSGFIGINDFPYRPPGNIVDITWITTAPHGSTYEFILEGLSDLFLKETFVDINDDPRTVFDYTATPVTSAKPTITVVPETIIETGVQASIPVIIESDTQLSVNSATGLPTGLSYSSGSIRGISTVFGRFTVTITARNTAGVTTATTVIESRLRPKVSNAQDSIVTQLDGIRVSLGNSVNKSYYIHDLGAPDTVVNINLGSGIASFPGNNIGSANLVDGISVTTTRSGNLLIVTFSGTPTVEEGYFGSVGYTSRYFSQSSNFTLDVVGVCGLSPIGDRTFSVNEPIDPIVISWLGDGVLTVNVAAIRGISFETIDENSGQIVGTPSQITLGISITARLTSVTCSDSETFLFIVVEEAASVQDFSLPTLRVGVQIDNIKLVTSPLGGTVDSRNLMSLTGLNISNSTISGVPTKEGRFDVEFVPTHPQRGNSVIFTKLFVVLGEAEQSPTVDFIPNIRAAVGDVVTISLGITDPDGDLLTTLVSGLPLGLSYNTGNFTISGTLSAAPGSYNVRVRAFDARRTFGERTFIITVERVPPTPLPTDEPEGVERFTPTPRPGTVPTAVPTAAGSIADQAPELFSAELEVGTPLIKLTFDQTLQRTSDALPSEASFAARLSEPEEIDLIIDRVYPVTSNFVLLRADRVFTIADTVFLSYISQDTPIRGTNGVEVESFSTTIRGTSDKYIISYNAGRGDLQLIEPLGRELDFPFNIEPSSLSKSTVMEDANGAFYIYVQRSNDYRIWRYLIDGTRSLVVAWRSFPSGSGAASLIDFNVKDGIFYAPSSASVDRLLRLDSDGVFSSALLHASNGTPCCAAIYENEIFIYDRSNRNVFVYDLDSFSDNARLSLNRRIVLSGFPPSGRGVRDLAVGRNTLVFVDSRTSSRPLGASFRIFSKSGGAALYQRTIESPTSPNYRVDSVTFTSFFDVNEVAKPVEPTPGAIPPTPTATPDPQGVEPPSSLDIVEFGCWAGLENVPGNQCLWFYNIKPPINVQSYPSADSLFQFAIVKVTDDTYMPVGQAEVAPVFARQGYFGAMGAAYIDPVIAIENDWQILLEADNTQRWVRVPLSVSKTINDEERTIAEMWNFILRNFKELDRIHGKSLISAGDRLTVAGAEYLARLAGQPVASNFQQFSEVQISTFQGPEYALSTPYPGELYIGTEGTILDVEEDLQEFGVTMVVLWLLASIGVGIFIIAKWKEESSARKFAFYASWVTALIFSGLVGGPTATAFVIASIVVPILLLAVRFIRGLQAQD